MSRHNIWNFKLERFDFTIDLAEIKRLSIKMRVTGVVSKKVLKKWRKRERKNIHKGMCDKCSWLPDVVVYGKKALEFHTDTSMWWACRKCHCVTAWVWEDEVSEPMRSAYKEFTKKRGDSTPQGIEYDLD